MSRSLWKGPFVDGYLLKKAEAARTSGRHDVIKIWTRRSTILPQFVGLNFGVYNGHKHIPVLVTEEMVGHKFGEFAPSRTFHGHTAVDNVVMADTVQFIGGNAGNDPGADHAKHLARQATGDPHFFRFV